MGIRINMHDKRKPPESVIMTGYNMIVARRYLGQDYGKYSPGIACGYIGHALECAEEAEADLAEENPGMLHMLFGEGRGLLLEAYNHLCHGLPETGPLAAEAVKHKISHAHKLLRQQYKRLGYRELTHEDFLKHGVGGGGGR